MDNPIRKKIIKDCCLKTPTCLSKALGPDSVLKGSCLLLLFKSNNVLYKCLRLCYKKKAIKHIL